MLGKHDFYAVPTTGELVGQNLAAQKSWLAGIKAWRFARAACWYADRDFLGAAGARVLDANRHGYRRWWTNACRRTNRNANWNAYGCTFRFASILGTKTAKQAMACVR